jgi:hypothetical protein
LVAILMWSILWYVSFLFSSFACICFVLYCIQQNDFMALAILSVADLFGSTYLSLSEHISFIWDYLWEYDNFRNFFPAYFHKFSNIAYKNSS